MFKRKTTYIENWFFMEQQCNVKFWRRKHSRKRNSIVTKDLHAQNKRLIVSIQYRDDAHCFFFDFIRVVYFECFALRSYGQMWALFCNGCAKKFAKRYQSTHGSFTDPYQFFSFVLYSPDPTPCNFFLFPELKSIVKGHRFGTTNDITVNLLKVLQDIFKEIFQDCFVEWKHHRKNCIVNIK